MLWLTLRAHAIATPLALAVSAAALSILTSLSWIASTLLTDIFTGLSVLALYLVTLRAETLARWERWALIALIAFSAATHTATLAVLLALLFAGVLIAVVRRRVVPFAGLARGGFALAISIVLLLAANVVVAGRIAWTPGGSAIPFGRMLQAGIVTRYLAEHCPDARLPKLCANRDKLPTDTDFFFWGSDLFDQLGRFEGLGEEMRIVVRESLTAYPVMQIKAAIAATAEQLMRVATGYGVHTEIWHTYVDHRAICARVGAGDESRAAAARRSRFRHDQPPACPGRLGVDAPADRRSRAVLRGATHFQNVRELAAVVTLAILANAAVCGALSNPHDRYGARIVWLATLVVLIAAWRARSTASPGGVRII